MAPRPSLRAVSPSAGLRRLGLWSGAVICCLLAWACGNGGPDRSREPERSGYLLTSFGVVQDWTAQLLDGVDQSMVLFDETVNAPQPKLSPVQIDILSRAPALVLMGTTLDHFAAAAWSEHSASGAPLIRIYGEPLESAYVWMDPRRAEEGITSLSLQLRALYPTKAHRIAENEAEMIAELRRLDSRIEALLSSVPSRSVLIEDVRIRPFLDRYEFQVEGALFPSVDRALVTPSVEPFRSAATSSATRILIMTSQGRDPLIHGLCQELNLRVVSFDPMIAGRTDRGHYWQEMSRSAMNLALALLSATPSAPPPGAE